ncbi:phosphonoacetaldehyde reductase [Alishewanella longhuensis]
MGDSVHFDYQHQQSVTIISGADAFANLRRYCEQRQGADLKILVLTTQGHQQRGSLQPLLEQVNPHPVTVVDNIQPNPDIDALDTLIAALSPHGFNVVVGFGGGSVLDAAKIIACAIEGTSKRPLHQRFRANETASITRSCSLISVPTTAGSGAEVTPFATVWDDAKKRKYSLTGAAVAPDAALLDARLTLSLPAFETLYSGLDALSHSMESLWNTNRTPISEAYSRQAFRLIVQALPDVLANPADTHSRAMMQQASLLAGLAIATTRTAVAHSMSYPLTSHYHVPHGIACSYTLPGVLQVLKQDSEGQLAELLHDLYEPAMQLLAQLPIMAELENYVKWPQIEALLPEMDVKQRSGNFVMPVDAAIMQRILAETHAFYNER